MFAGLTSRWTIPASCAASSAEPDSASQRSAVSSSISRPDLSRSADAAAGQQLHHDVGLALVLPDVVDRGHVGVGGEAGGGPRLALEALARAVVLAEVRGQHLDGHGAVQDLVVGLPDARHPAVGDVPDHPVAVGQRDAGGRTGHGSPRYPAAAAAILWRRNGPNLSLLRKAPGLRPEPLALHGRHEAAVRREPPEGAHHRGGAPKRVYVCTRCLKAGKVTKA